MGLKANLRPFKPSRFRLVRASTGWVFVSAATPGSPPFRILMDQPPGVVMIWDNDLQTHRLYDAQGIVRSHSEVIADRYKSQVQDIIAYQLPISPNRPVSQARSVFLPSLSVEQEAARKPARRDPSRKDRAVDRRRTLLR